LKISRNMAAEMLYTGYARIIRASNATQKEINRHDAPGARTAVAAPVSKTYQSTGVQTQPLCDGSQFFEIFGRNPLVTEVGTAAIGRYEIAGGASLYNHEYGQPFAAEPSGDSRPEGIDAAFQTIPYRDAVRCITKAKVKATMMVNRYRKVAEEAGVRVFAESKAENVIHSEQFTPLVTLNAEGNAKNGDLGSLFLPNIYGEEITQLTEHTLKPPRSPDSELQARLIVDIHLQHVIPSLAPSLREDVPSPESKEDYGEVYNEAQWAAEYEKRFLGDGGRGDGVPPTAFIVHDPSSFPVPTEPSKRKRAIDNERHTSQTSRKRTKRSPSPNRIKQQTPHSQQYRAKRNPVVSRHREELRECKSSTAEVPIHNPIAFKSSLKFDNIPRGPRKDRERTATNLACTPRRRSASPRRDDYEQRHRSRSPATHDSKPRRDRGAHRNEVAQEGDSVRDKHRSSRDYNARRDDHVTELQTPVSKKLPHASNTPGILTNPAFNTPRTQISIHQSTSPGHAHGPTHNNISTPTPTTQTQRKQQTPTHNHSTHHTPHTLNPSPAPRKPTTKPPTPTPLNPPTPLNTTPSIPQNLMHLARLAENRRRERAHASLSVEPAVSPRHQRTQNTSTASSRVDKTYRTPSKDGVHKQEERKTSGLERRMPSAPRPRRDARSLINRWLGA
ncbi:hypothetical protein T440DRAFT_400707, partial [Plenodomus tracheiphilus IPT5]